MPAKPLQAARHATDISAEVQPRQPAFRASEISAEYFSF